MSETYHEIADCPECGKRDFVEQDENQWVCLNCGFSKDVSQSEPEPSRGIRCLRSCTSPYKSRECKKILNKDT
ncbi:hypothetical protein SAMD00079811_78910 (plasmid) [Scytonema sp. HK-05]|uniref:hypothetical protein n=1 Tax=Scytonema sp. HK-05 TaxID=1137095 RepID=UPI000936D139|nr:hypothetical protein [Scytonema sp. HK-05]BAY50262.1 hypothetical protein SAMD00079811_78910 [Scytonema sp. HK-05]